MSNRLLQEFQENETLTVEKVEISQSVNIFGCKGATILIKGKVNAVNISEHRRRSYFMDLELRQVPLFSQQHKDLRACSIRRIICLYHRLALLPTADHRDGTHDPARLD